MAAALGMIVAAAFGSGDFFGGRASRESTTSGALVFAQLTALVGALTVAVAVHATVATDDVLFGAIAGMCNVTGLALLYRGLATGRMSIVAPITAVVGAIVPVTWALVIGERPNAAVLAGVVLAIGAGALIAREPDQVDDSDTAAVSNERSEASSLTSVALAVGSGLAFGTSFIFFAKTGTESGFWPVLSARVVAVVLVLVAALVFRQRGSLVLPAGTARTMAIGAGALDVTATTVLLFAVRHELAVAVAPIAGLAPAFTVVLAWRILGEPVSRHQLVGLVLALVGIVLIATG